MPYMTIVKLRKNEQFGMSGNTVAIPIPAAQLTADALNRVMELPRRDVTEYYAVMFIGRLDTMRRLMSLDPKDDDALQVLYNKHLNGQF